MNNFCAWPTKPRTPKTNQLFVFVMNGFLGDQCSALPTMKWILNDQIGLENTLIAIRPELEFIYHFVPKKNLIRFEDLNSLNSLPMPVNILQQFTQHSEFMKCHPCDYYAFNWFGKITPHSWRNIPQAPQQKISKGLEKTLKSKKISPMDLNHAVIIPVASRTESKSWNLETLTEIVAYLKQCDLTPIFIGFDDREAKSEYVTDENHMAFIGNTHDNKRLMSIILKQGVDLTNTTTLKDCLYLFQNSRLLIGMEGGLAHLASLSSIPMIIGYTLVNPIQRMPWRNNSQGWGITPLSVAASDPQNSGCKFCMTDWFVGGWQWDQCYRHHFVDAREKFTCKNIPFEKWKAAINEAIK